MEEHKEMFALVDSWRASGLSKVRFCKEHDLKVHTLRYWNRKKNEKESPSGFRLIESEMNVDKVSVNYPNGVSVEAALDLDLIRNLIHLY